MMTSKLISKARETQRLIFERKRKSINYLKAKKSSMQKGYTKKCSSEGNACWGSVQLRGYMESWRWEGSLWLWECTCPSTPVLAEGTLTLRGEQLLLGFWAAAKPALCSAARKLPLCINKVWICTHLDTPEWKWVFVWGALFYRQNSASW